MPIGYVNTNASKIMTSISNPLSEKQLLQCALIYKNVSKNVKHIKITINSIYFLLINLIYLLLISSCKCLLLFCLETNINYIFNKFVKLLNYV